jgi:hypothetical protein
MNSEVVNFSNGLIDQLCENGKLRTAERYAVTLNSFKRFLGEKEVFLENVDSTLMMGYEVYLKNVGVCPNTSSFYMRNLRAMYNRAVEQGLTEQRFPFKHVYTGVEKTVKRAVSIEVIRSLRSLDLSSYPVLDWARDMFLFSFYTRGMSFIDMAFLKKRDLKNGLLDYRRQKTGQRLFVKWEKPMQDIVDKYLATADKKRSLPASQNSYYMAILGAVYARLGQSQLAKTCLANIVRGCAMNNLVFVDKDWRGMGICGSGVWTPVQLHTNMVFAHDLQQMLMYSCGDVVKLFPALPKDWKLVKFSNFVTQNGVLVSCDYNHAKGTLKIALETKRERPLILHLPDNAKRLVSCNLDTKPTGKVIEIQLQANKKIELLYKC